MAPPKQKPVKMGLGEFLGDQSLGSWADEMEDMPTNPSSGQYSASGSGRRGYGGEGTGGGRDRDDRFPPRHPLPFPDNPPYTAHVGNLLFDVTETQISEFFAACDVDHVRLVRDKTDDRPKGFGYVEFKTKQGLVAAVDLNGTQFCGRNVRISVAEPPKDRGDDRTQGEWRRSGPPPPLDQPMRRGSERHSDRFGEGRQGYNEASDRPPAREPREFDWAKKTPLPPVTPTGSDHGGRPRSGEREFRRRSPVPSEGAPRREYRERSQVDRQPTAPERNSAWRSTARADSSVPLLQEPTQKSTPPSPIVPHVRPKLELKPRSGNPVEPGPASAASVGESSKSNPFGAARPIDTAQREKEVAEKRAAAIAARKTMEEKAREERKVRAAAEADRQSEAGTPTGSNTRNPSFSGRTSEGASGGGEEDREDRPKKKEDWPSKVAIGSWRTARSDPKEKGFGKEPKVDTGKVSGSGAAEEDGWTPVSGKRGRGNANGTKNSAAGS